MLTIRFARMGRKKQAFFHLVAADKRRATQKKIVEKLGYYNPHTEGGQGEFVFDADRIKYYIGNGAQVSETVARKLVKEGLKEAGKFVHDRPTKPKKEAPKPEVTEAPAEEAAPEAPAEEATVPEKAPEESKEEAPAEEEKPAN